MSCSFKKEPVGGGTVTEVRLSALRWDFLISTRNLYKRFQRLLGQSCILKYVHTMTPLSSFSVVGFHNKTFTEHRILGYRLLIANYLLE